MVAQVGDMTQSNSCHCYFLSQCLTACLSALFREIPVRWHHVGHGVSVFWQLNGRASEQATVSKSAYLVHTWQPAVCCACWYHGRSCHWHIVYFTQTVTYSGGKLTFWCVWACALKQGLSSGQASGHTTISSMSNHDRHLPPNFNHSNLMCSMKSAAVWDSSDVI